MTEPTNGDSTDNKWQCTAKTTQILVRSKIEIARFLTEIANRQTLLTTVFAKEHYFFITQICHIDPQHEYMLIHYGDNRAMNSALLETQSITFSAPQGHNRIEFIAENPTDAIFEGASSIRFDFPNILMLHQRRAQHRFPVVPKVPLRCMADTRGILSFEWMIVDISRGGLGTMIYDNSIILEPGTVLRGCEIVHTGTVTKVDIEVTYCMMITLPDGTSARRAGCRFIGTTVEIDNLIDIFMLNIEDTKRDADY